MHELVKRRSSRTRFLASAPLAPKKSCSGKAGSTTVRETQVATEKSQNWGQRQSTTVEIVTLYPALLKPRYLTKLQRRVLPSASIRFAAKKIDGTDLPGKPKPKQLPLGAKKLAGCVTGKVTRNAVKGSPLFQASFLRYTENK